MLSDQTTKMWNVVKTKMWIVWKSHFTVSIFLGWKKEGRQRSGCHSAQHQHKRARFNRQLLYSTCPSCLALALGPCSHQALHKPSITYQSDTTICHSKQKPLQCAIRFTHKLALLQASSPLWFAARTHISDQCWARQICILGPFFFGTHKRYTARRPRSKPHEAHCQATHASGQSSHHIVWKLDGQTSEGRVQQLAAQCINIQHPNLKTLQSF